LPTVTLVIRRELRPQIRSIQDLKGRRIGVTAIGAGTHQLAASILRKAGYSLSDVQIVPVGSGTPLITAMKLKQIDAAMATDPTTTRLLLNGDGSLLLDMVTYEDTQRVFNGEYQFTGLLARPEVMAARPELVQSMVNAVVRTNRFMATHSAADIAAQLPPAIVQDRSRRTYYGRDVPQQGRLIWPRPARDVVNFTRACDYLPFRSPWGHPVGHVGGRQVAVAKTTRTGEPCAARPGTVGDVVGRAVRVACADEWVLVHRVVMEGQLVDASCSLRPGQQFERENGGRE